MNDTVEKTDDDGKDIPLEGHFYKLVGKKPVACSFEEYATLMQKPSARIVEQTRVGSWLVSTIFTGIDHAFGTGEKRLFETVVFGLSDDLQPRWRWATWNQAVRQHRRLVVSLEQNGADALMAEIGNCQT